MKSPPFFSYFDSWHYALLRGDTGDKLRLWNWVFPSQKTSYGLGNMYPIPTMYPIPAITWNLNLCKTRAHTWKFYIMPRSFMHLTLLKKEQPKASYGMVYIYSMYPKMEWFCRNFFLLFYLLFLNRWWLSLFVLLNYWYASNLIFRIMKNIYLSS